MKNGRVPLGIAGAVNFMEMIVPVLFLLIALGGTPLLMFLAWKGWDGDARRLFPVWRNGVATASFLLLLIDLGIHFHTTRLCFPRGRDRT
jgi:hypothetical protein